MSGKKATFIILLIAFGFFVYSFNLRNGLFWDDDNWIINNLAVHEFSWNNIKFWFQNNTLAGVGLKSNYYRPFLFFTFALNYVLAGIKPLGYHLFSNGIHIANGVLVFLLLNKVLTTSDVQRTSDVKIPGRWVAFLTALIFTIHPLQTEAVTYISGRGDGLVVFFVLLALWFFAKSNPTTPNVSGSHSQRHSITLWWLSIFSLVLALLSRETAIIFPFLALIFYISFISKERFLKSIKQGLIKTWSYFAVVIAYGTLRLTVLNFQNTLNFYAVPNVYSENLHVRIFTFMKALTIYFKLLLVPVGLHMERGVDPLLSFWNWPVWPVALVLILLCWFIFFLYRKNDRRDRRQSRARETSTQRELRHWDKEKSDSGTGPAQREEQFRHWDVWFFGAAWFFTALGPVSGITPINALLYEHWLYLPMVGFWLIISFYATKFLDYLKSRGKILFLVPCLLLLVAYLSFFSTQSIKRNILWGKPIPFYEDILKYEPDSVRINNNLGNMHYNKGDLARAEEYYWKAVSEEDIFAQPHFNLGSILESRGDIAGAVFEYKKAIEIDPDFYYAYQNLASIYGKQGDLEGAWLNIEKLLTLRPGDPRMYYNAGLIKQAMGDKKVALGYAEKGLLLTGSDQEIREMLRDLLSEIRE